LFFNKSITYIGYYALGPCIQYKPHKISVITYVIIHIYIAGKVVGRKWENAMTIDKYSWGYRRNARALDVYSIQNLISQLVETVSFGGKLI